MRRESIATASVTMRDGLGRPKAATAGEASSWWEARDDARQPTALQAPQGAKKARGGPPGRLTTARGPAAGSIGPALGLLDQEIAEDLNAGDRLHLFRIDQIALELRHLGFAHQLHQR